MACISTNRKNGMTPTAFSDGESLGVAASAVSSAIALFSVSQLYKPVQASVRDAECRPWVETHGYHRRSRSATSEAALAERGHDGSRGLQPTGSGGMRMRRGATLERGIASRSSVAPRRGMLGATRPWVEIHSYRHRSRSATSKAALRVARP